MVSGSRKGSAFEREIGRTLSNWLTRDADDTQLIRSVSSGGWSRRKDNQVGDLAANGPEGRRFRKLFTIECKARKDFSFQHVWSSASPALASWWEQVHKEGEDFGLIPMLVYRKPYVPTLVGFPADFAYPLFPEAPGVTVHWGAALSNHDPVFLTELDELIVLDPDKVVHYAEDYLLSP